MLQGNFDVLSYTKPILEQIAYIEVRPAPIFIDLQHTSKLQIRFRVQVLIISFTPLF